MLKQLLAGCSGKSASIVLGHRLTLTLCFVERSKHSNGSTECPFNETAQSIVHIFGTGAFDSSPD